MNRVDELPEWVWSGTLILVGLDLAVIHLYHFTGESLSLAAMIGVVIPLGISFFVAVVGILIPLNSQLKAIAPWLTGWMLLGMAWMAVAGLGAVLYETAEGVSLSHARFLVAIFVTYGCLPGMLTGWYDGRRRRQIRTISDREGQLALLSRILRHNLRNAMNVIIGRAEMIKHDTSNDPAAHAKAIIRAGDDLLELTEKERELVNTHVNPSDRTTLDLESFLSNVVEQLQDSYPAAEIAVAENTHHRVRAVPEVERALEELLVNTIAYNEADSPRISIDVEMSSDFVTLQITDNGEGIPSEEIEAVTEKESISQVRHGSGVGLQLADVIIRQSDGNLKFSSADPHGTKVHVTLPTA